jgi:hypothetical protein
MYNGEIVVVSKTDFVAGYKFKPLFWLGKKSRYWIGKRKMNCVDARSGVHTLEGGLCRKTEN